MTKKKKCIVIYMEGETESEFYDLLLEEIKKEYKIAKFKADKLIKRNLKGITKFDKKLLKKYEYEIKNKYKGYEIIVFLCYDSDTFEFSKNPPVDWNDVETKLKQLGATRVYHIKAEKSIEDFFFLDIDGIIKYLQIDKPKKITGKNAIEKLQRLFEKGNKLYQKGYPSEGFIKSLDMKLILEKILKIIKPLIDELIDK